MFHRNRRTTAALRIGLLCTLLSGGATLAVAAEQLVPSSWNPRLDPGGFNWDIEQRGALADGNNDCVDGGLVLLVNGQEFYNQQGQPMATADGSELVQTGAVGTLEVTRRCRIDETEPGARFVDVFHNPTGQAQSVQVQIMTQFGGQFLTPVSESGAGGDSALLCVQHPTGRPSMLFVVADPKSKIKPTITNNQNYQVYFNFQLEIPARGTAAVCYTAVQMNLNVAPDASALEAMIKPYRTRSWLADLPSDVRRAIVNFGRGGGLSELPDLLASLEELGIDRGPRDVLAIGDQTRMQGTAAAASLEIETRFGRATFELEQVAAIRGGGPDGAAQVFFRDGQMLYGKLTAQSLQFTLPSGLAIDLRNSPLDRLVLKEGPLDGHLAGDAAALLQTYSGDRLALTSSGDARLAVLTPWGERALTLAEVRSISPTEEGLPGYRVTLRDGSRFFAYLMDARLSAHTLLFGPQEIPAAEIVSVFTAESAAETAATEEALEQQPHLTLAGDNVFVGQIESDALHLLVSGTVIPLAPHEVRLLESAGDDSDGVRTSLFNAHLWDGGLVQGVLQESVLAVRTGASVVQIPVADLVSAQVPSPLVPDAVRDQIAGLIRDLSHDEYAAREAATNELTSLGILARAQLVEAARLSRDPEALRRIRALLDHLEGAGP